MTLALPLLTLIAAGSSGAPLVVADAAAPPDCDGNGQRHELLLPLSVRGGIPTNASFWFKEHPNSPVDPAFIRDPGVGEVAVDEIVHATGAGVVLELKPQTELAPNHEYEVILPNGYADPFVVKVTTGANRDTERPRAPTIVDVENSRLNCIPSGLYVSLEAEAETITFAEDPANVLLGYGVYAVEIPATPDTEIEFVAYSIDVAGNVSVDTKRRTVTVEEPKVYTNGWFGCRCVRTRAGWLAGLLVLPALLALRRR